jgi:hypothetical protein
MRTEQHICCSNKNQEAHKTKETQIRCKIKKPTKQRNYKSGAKESGEIGERCRRNYFLQSIFLAIKINIFTIKICIDTSILLLIHVLYGGIRAPCSFDRGERDSSAYAVVWCCVGSITPPVRPFVHVRAFSCLPKRVALWACASHRPLGPAAATVLC